MSTPIIRGTAATYDLPSLPSDSGSRNIFRRGCFDHLDLKKATPSAMISHEPSRVFFCHRMTMWLDDNGLQYEMVPKPGGVSRLAIAGIRCGVYRGSSLSASYRNSKTVTVAGERCEEVAHVVRIEDIGPCGLGASPFAGVCLLDKSQAPSSRAGSSRRRNMPRIRDFDFDLVPQIVVDGPRVEKST
ncbi:MAG: hypothetical protein GY903_20845 [Fuerstiella sp.]|nr:hypothetical protein [Fuerstiella sp.]MCP4856938.1 hypothetical protein [Fuerstiella sp.]